MEGASTAVPDIFLRQNLCLPLGLSGGGKGNCNICLKINESIRREAEANEGTLAI